MRLCPPLPLMAPSVITDVCENWNGIDGIYSAATRVAAGDVTVWLHSATSISGLLNRDGYARTYMRSNGHVITSMKHSLVGRMESAKYLDHCLGRCVGNLACLVDTMSMPGSDDVSSEVNDDASRRLYGCDNCTL